MDEKTLSNPKTPDSDPARPDPKANVPASKDAIVNFATQMKSQHPLPAADEPEDHEHVRNRLNHEVLTPLHAGKMTFEQATELWIEIVSAPPPPVLEVQDQTQQQTEASKQPDEIFSHPPKASETPQAAPDPNSPEFQSAQTVPMTRQPPNQSPQAHSGPPPIPKPGTPAQTPPGQAPPAQAPPAQTSPQQQASAESEADLVEEPPQKRARITAEWKVLEPSDRSDPVEHDICEQKIRDDRWTITAASVRGKLHAHKALWRDDAYGFDKVDRWTILVVSDGAGSAKLSRVGSRLACDACVDVMKTLLDGFQFTSPDPDQPSQSDLKRLQTFLAEAARKARVQILREAQQRSCQPRDFYATLLLMVHAPLESQELVAALQVGDGAVGVYTADGTCTLVGVADHGEFSSETRFLTTPNIEYEFENRVVFSLKKDIRCLAAMSDGVSDDFFPEQKRLVEMFHGDPIDDMKSPEGEDVRGVLHSVLCKENSAEALKNWLKYERRGSSDDRTLLLMHQEGCS